MDENTRTKRINLAKLLSVSVVIVVMFIAGSLSGGSFIYGLTSSEINDLQYQIENLQYGSNNIEFQNITYFYNETSLSDLYKCLDLTRVFLLSRLIQGQEISHMHR